MKSNEHNPTVSVIVPARNEEISLGACRQSLLSQGGMGFEVIVVDDSSTDHTGEIARTFPGVQVIEAGPLPHGWTGKNNAMAAGAKVARGKWLLFTDADTVHKPGSLAAAVAEAERHGAALVSYSPEQEVSGLLQQAVMPVIFGALAATYPPSRVNDPASPIAAANGQYLLISRAAYDALGGHTKIAGDLLEDVAMARLVKSSGRKIFFRYGGDAVRTRMYRSWAQLREGWSKNLALLFPSAFRLALLRAAESLLIFATAAIAVGTVLHGQVEVAALLGAVSLAFCGLFLIRIRKAHFGWGKNLLALFGMPIFSYLLLASKFSYWQGTVHWKGRSYGRPGSGKVITFPGCTSAPAGKVKGISS
jgi:glycosyltransferase involved in cell wall biosynthesis